MRKECGKMIPKRQRCGDNRRRRAYPIEIGTLLPLLIVCYRIGFEMGLNKLKHLPRVVTAFIVAGVFLLGLLPVAARSQDAFDTVIEVKGKFKGARGNEMVVTREDGTDVTIVLDPDPTRLLFSANAKPEWIRTGMLVRLESMFGPTGQPPEPVASIDLLQPFQASRDKPPRREYYIPGIYPLDNPAEGQPAGFRPGNYRVIGQIVGMNATGILIAAGPIQVMVPVAADAKWQIRFHNLLLAQPDDPVHVNGFHKPPDETLVKGGDVRVTVERVIGEATESVRGKRRNRREPKEAAPPAKEAAAADAAADAPEAAAAE